MSSPLPWSSPVEATALTRELRAVGLPLAGLTVEPTQIVLRRETGDFTAAELSTAQTVLAAHDAAAVRAAAAARETNRQNERAKNPLSLSLPERVRRLEIVAGLD